MCRHQRTSLRVLATVGEPINPEAWLWYHRVIGNSNCAIVDTFWQTETVSALGICMELETHQVLFHFLYIQFEHWLKYSRQWYHFLLRNSVFAFESAILSLLT